MVFEPETEIVKHRSPIRQVVYSPDGTHVATADVGRVVRLYRDNQLLWERSFRIENERYRAMDLIRAMSFDKTGRFLFVGAGETIIAIDLLTGLDFWQNEVLPTYGFLITTPLWVDFSERNDCAVAYADGSIDVYAVQEDQIWLRSRWMDNDSPFTISFLRGGERLAGTDHFSICVWDAASGIKLARSVPGEKMHALASSPVADVIAARTLSEIWLWHTDSGELIGRAATQPGLPTLAFSPTAELVAVTDAGGVNLHAFNGKLVERFEVNYGVPLSINFAPDGHEVTIGLSTGEIRSFDISPLAVV